MNAAINAVVIEPIREVVVNVTVKLARKESNEATHGVDLMNELCGCPSCFE